MSVTATASACPACAAAPAAEAIAEAAGHGDHLISLPGIHCALCISSVEKGLQAVPGVRSARVNLTLKRATVDADTGVETADLIARLDRLGFEAFELDPGQLTQGGADKQARDLLMRMGVAGFGMMNVMLLSVAVWSGAEDATRDMFHWISAMIALPIIAFSGQPFFVNAWAALRAGRLNMDVPISLAILLAAGMSLYETVNSGEHAYFDAAISLTFFLLAGRYLDFRTRASARSAAQELAAMEVPRAQKLIGGAEVTVPVGELAVGDLIRILPGTRVPADGVIETGRSELDRALLTGETLPALAEPGTLVNAGEVNLTGVLCVRVTAAGRDTALHRMADLVAAAENARTRYTSLADKAAGLYAPGVHIMALFAAVGWYIYTLDLRIALNIASAVLIITCPCALGLAVPAVVTAASGRLFRKGLLIKDGTALERLAEVDTVVFDKTGTLTLGMPELQDVSGFGEADLQVAMGLASGSAHPLAKALYAAGERHGSVAVALTDVTEVPGYGVEARLNGGRVRLGRAAWVGAETGDETATWLSIEGNAPVEFRFSDRLRPGAVQAVADLQAKGLRVLLLSGDTAPAVAAVTLQLGITEATGNCLPEDKAARIAEMTQAGARVLMVGDGLNDTAALTAAHVSISPASALDAARVASDIVFLGQDLSPLGDALVTSRKSIKRIRENFTISTIYNVLAVPLAIAGFATPLIAALAMSTSSITVGLNSIRLR
ncbi:MAG: Cu2+-exporting ATPase [Sulfitobacter sp.]|jgi:Cu2+-exporting ATPase